MATKWPSIAYVDLFAGAGRSLLRDAKRIIPASPLLVLNISRPFSKYLFVELDPEKAAALKLRIASTSGQATVINKDANAAVDDLLQQIPQGALVFCFADPYNLEALRLETLSRIAHGCKTDFLVLLASGMDANRNIDKYLHPSDPVIASFTGSSDWRSRWPHDRLGFGDFVADEFGRRMQSIGYLYDGLGTRKRSQTARIRHCTG